MLTSRVFLVPHLVTLVLDEHRGHATDMLEALGQAGERFRAEEPAAVVVLSARGVGQGPFLVGASARHRTITDYSGFGVELRYDCHGNPELARELVAAGRKAGLRVATTDRGVDSGVTVPLHFLLPAGGTRVVPLWLASFSALECRRWGECLQSVLAGRPERIAFVVGGMLSHDEHAWQLKRDVPESAAFDDAALEAIRSGRWSDLPLEDSQMAHRAKPQAGLRHLEVLRGFLGADLPGVVHCYESAPGMGAALVEFAAGGVGGALGSASGA